MKNTKNLIVLEKKNIQEKGYKDLSDILDNIPSINVGKSGWEDIDITTNLKRLLKPVNSAEVSIETKGEKIH